MARENIDVTVELHDALSRPAHRTEEAIEDLRAETERLNRTLKDSSAAQARAASATRALGAAMGRSKKDWKQYGREVRAANDELTRTDRVAMASRRALGELGGGLRLLGRNFDKTGKNSKGFAGVFKAMKIPAIATAVTLLATAVSALGAAGVAAVAGLAPLVGVLGAMPALGAAVGQMGAAVKLGFGGIGEALKVLTDPTATAEKLNEALSKLGPEARELATTMAELKEQTDGWKKSVQTAMLPGFTKAIKGLGGLLPIVERNLTATGGALGALAEQGGRNVAGWGADLDMIMQRNTRMIRNGLGPALLSVLTIVKNLMVAGGPLAERFALWIGRSAAALDRMVQAGKDSGKLEAFFGRAGDLAAKVGRVIGDIAVGLFNIGKESGDLSGFMGRGITDAAKAFRDWTGSVEGKASIRAFFQDAIPVVRELTLLIRDAVKAFGGLAQNESLAPLIAQVRTDLLPAITDLAGNFTERLGPALISLATSYAEFMNVLSFDPIVTAATIVADLVSQLSEWIALTPGMSTFVATLLTAVTAYRLLAFASQKSGMTALVTSMTASTGKIRVFTQALRGNTTALQANKTASTGAAKAGRIFRAGLTGLAKGAKAVAGAFVRMGIAAATALGPWGLAIIAIVALFVLLYKKNERFRELVNRVRDAIVAFGKAAWGWIKKVADVVGTFLVAAWGKVVPIVVGVAKAIWGAMQSVWGVVKTVFGAIWGVVKTVLGLVVGYFRVVFKVWKTFFEVAAGIALFVFRNIIAPAAKWLADKLGAAWGWIRDKAVAAFTWVAGKAAWLWAKILYGINVLRAVWNVAWTWIKEKASAAFAPIAAGAEWAWRKISTGARWLKDEVVRRFGVIRERVGKVWDWIKDKAKAAFDGLMGVVQPIIDRIQRAFQGLKDAVGGVWDGIRSGFGSAMDSIRGVINGVIRTVNKLIDGLNAVKVGEDIPNIPELGGSGQGVPRTVAQAAASRATGRFAGGPVMPGVGYTVAELGPELFVPRIGPISVLGGDGGAMPARFPTAGYVVPNPGTPDSLTNPIPSWVTDRLEPNRGGSGGGGTAVMTEAVPDVHLHFHGEQDGITAADVETAALRAWRRFDRERRERR